MDMDGLDFMDDSGNSFWVRIIVYLWERNVIVAVIGLTPYMKSMFKLTKMHHITDHSLNKIILNLKSRRCQ